MHLDQLTLDDLSIVKGEHALYLLLDKCHTKEGSLLLRKRLQEPYAALEDIVCYQKALEFWHKYGRLFQCKLTNGTIMMLQQFIHSNEFNDRVHNDMALRVNTLIKKVVDKESLEHIAFLTEQMIFLVKDAI